MTADELLAIQRPEHLFPGDLDGAKVRFRELSVRWHPDKPTGSHEVFSHITELFREAVEKLKTGRWDGSGARVLKAVSGVTYHIPALAGFDFALGRGLVTDGAVHYLFEKQHGDFADRARRAPAFFSFASPRMRDEFEKYLPKPKRGQELLSGQHWVPIPKTPDLIRLRDLHTHLGPLDAKGCAWIVSSLMNLVCYFAHTGVVHHDISPDTVFVSPPHHSATVLGGWEYAVKRGERLTFVPQRTFDLMPFRAKTRKMASTRTDLELIRATAREVFRLPTAEPLQTWLHSVSHATAFDQYNEWHRVLERSFGPRRFIAMLTSADDVYGKPLKGVN